MTGVLTENGLSVRRILAEADGREWRLVRSEVFNAFAYSQNGGNVAQTVSLDDVHCVCPSLAVTSHARLVKDEFAPTDPDQLPAYTVACLALGNDQEAERNGKGETRQLRDFMQLLATLPAAASRPQLASSASSQCVP